MGREIFILNGPNLNLLGMRQPEVYGRATLGDIEEMCRSVGDDLGLSVDFRQTNSEGELVDWIQEARDTAGGLILNAAAYTHTSVAIYDALLACDGLPVVEVHLSNVHAREGFRKKSYVSPVATGIICGFGDDVYRLALEALARVIKES